MSDVFEVIATTWPPVSCHEAGGFVVREGAGGGSRVSAASLAGSFETADIAAAEAQHRALGQVPKFMIRPGEDALDAALAARGYDIRDVTLCYEAPIEAVQGEVPPVTAFAHWPPLQIARDLWVELGIGAERQAVMARSCPPKTCVLGRMQDRAAGAGFVAIHDRIAMVHALVIQPAMRRRGLARAMMHEAARWAQAQGAERMMLVVTEENAPANTLYRALGMQQIARYHYRVAAA
ncbi:GNAT family N-acetyltransferase [Pseudothioclava nitratireducens]|uniref:GNAT family N-acetyltransferase n=1 Tax=Pseudothioclava nitratireducens TaxID=1928646 RepID=UPI0023DAFBC4|nr:GNAT family N-acetyltransferase [Defluviimonas nitratireducens]MDF1619804.1 GNAT family N-acetyltransferase [Defluviimonas nitratireducens]